AAVRKRLQTAIKPAYSRTEQVIMPGMSTVLEFELENMLAFPVTAEVYRAGAALHDLACPAPLALPCAPLGATRPHAPLRRRPRRPRRGWRRPCAGRAPGAVSGRRRARIRRASSARQKRPCQARLERAHVRQDLPMLRP